MYTCGLNPKITDLYPTLKYPVSRGTPSIFGLPFWDHTVKGHDKYYEYVSKTLVDCNQHTFFYFNFTYINKLHFRF